MFEPETVRQDELAWEEVATRTIEIAGVNTSDRAFEPRSTGNGTESQRGERKQIADSEVLHLVGWGFAIQDFRLSNSSQSRKQILEHRPVFASDSSRYGDESTPRPYQKWDGDAETDQGGQPMFEPWDALEAPRFTGPRTYARLPYVKELDGVECAVFGMPWDGSASFRSGARFGPEAVRSASGMIRTYNAVQSVQVFGAVSTIDFGDAPTVPGYVEDTLERIAAFVSPLAEAGVVPFGIGGDHSVTLAELRALAAVHGPLGLVHLDSHTDLWDLYNGQPLSHGTMFRRALEEGVVDPSRMIQAGIRGPLYGEADEDIPAQLGVETISWIDLAKLDPIVFAQTVRARVGDGPTFLTLDVDFVDAAYCPGTGTPEVGGPTSFQALQLLRTMSGIRFVGFDVVEVAPQYDGPGQVTALFAANAIFELLSLVALEKRARMQSAVIG